ncbi:MAG: family 20 glycosylhydrolase [Ignavibacteria bacterium]|nr:family 20 glycosylhydrolase [Ignavibacteria bacterium]MBI3765502.1 family 20 glycosylhydrolase [Ignavibacteriales bacterium]
MCDDQGFRVESKLFPKLHETASDGLYYTQAEIKEILHYAGERGIRVVPEFDIPGHATSFVTAYPELSSVPGSFTLERNWGIFFPVLNPASEYTYDFLDKFFGEMTQLFPDPFFHIGGDEIESQEHKADHWDNNPQIQEFKKEHNLPDNSALQSYFNRRILNILTKYKKVMVGWDEILHETMPNTIVIQSWRGRESMESAAKKGFRSILSNGYYIDLIQPTEFHYLNDPIPSSSRLSDKEKETILGGEATMWSEYVSSETIDSRIWPRTAAIAERLWSPQTVNDVDDMYRRLDAISIQLEEHGLTHEKNYEMMLRRLTGTYDVEALKNLVDLVEPVKGYVRGRLKPHTAFSPLTRVVDAARPDARVARNFSRMVNQYIGDKEHGKALVEEMTRWLARWKNNHQQLAIAIKKSPSLAEIESLSEDLSTVSALGLEALTQLEKNNKEDHSWRKERMEVLQKAEEPRGETQLMIVPAIEKLVMAASSENGSSHNDDAAKEKK